MLSDLAGLGMVQQNPLDSLFGSVGTNTVAGLGGLNVTCLWSANSGNGLLRLAALLGGSQLLAVCHFAACSAPASKSDACATQVAAQHAEIQKRIETEATTQAAELVKIEKEKQKQKARRT